MALIDRWIFPLTLVSALGCGLVAGVFLAFSSFVMSALARLPASQGIATMQSINITVLNPLFMGLFMGTALTCLLLVISAFAKWHQPGAALLMLGGLLYFVGTFLVTIIFNVPLNDSLAAAKPDSVAGATVWASYITVWTAWNHVRTVAALGAAASLTLALCRHPA